MSKQDPISIEIEEKIKVEPKDIYRPKLLSLEMVQL